MTMNMHTLKYKNRLVRFATDLWEVQPALLMAPHLACAGYHVCADGSLQQSLGFKPIPRLRLLSFKGEMVTIDRPEEFGSVLPGQHVSLVKVIDLKSGLEVTAATINHARGTVTRSSGHALNRRLQIEVICRRTWSKIGTLFALYYVTGNMVQFSEYFLCAVLAVMAAIKISRSWSLNRRLDAEIDTAVSGALTAHPAVICHDCGASTQRRSGPRAPLENWGRPHFLRDYCELK